LLQRLSDAKSAIRKFIGLDENNEQDVVESSTQAVVEEETPPEKVRFVLKKHSCYY